MLAVAEHHAAPVGAGEGVCVYDGEGEGDGDSRRCGVNHVQHEPFRKSSETRTSTFTLYPGVALPTLYQNV